MTRIVLLNQLHLRNQRTMRRMSSSVLWRLGLCGLLPRCLGGECVQWKVQGEYSEEHLGSGTVWVLLGCCQKLYVLREGLLAGAMSLENNQLRSQKGRLRTCFFRELPYYLAKIPILLRMPPRWSSG